MSIDILASLMLVFATPFALLAGYGAIVFALGQWSRYWHPVIGKVESSAIKAARVANGLAIYWVGAQYSYHSGHARNGSWIGFAHPGTASNPKSARSIVETLQAELLPGARVDVFVCPQWPSISVLRQGPNPAALAYVGSGLLFCGSILWIAWHIWNG
jgi:hypothetical protein